MTSKWSFRTVVLLACLALTALITYQVTRPPTLEDVFRYSDASNLPEGATNIVVSGGKHAGETNYHVSFQAQPEESHKWLKQYRAEQDDNGDYIFGGLPGPHSSERLKTTKVRLRSGNQVNLYYNTHR